MSRIFRRGTSNTAEAASANNNNNNNNNNNTNVKRDGTKSRSRAASDAHSLHSILPRSPEHRQKHDQTRPQPPASMTRLDTGRQQHSGHTTGSPASQHTARFGENASEMPGFEVDIASSPISTAKRGSTSSSAQTSVRRSSTNPPSPHSELSHLAGENGKPDQRHQPQGADGEEELDFEMERDTRQRTRSSPLLKRLGEEAPFVLPHQSKIESASHMYPGVVIGSFAGGANHGTLSFGVDGMGFDGSMDDILDPSATHAGTRQGSASGQAGANIAPWLSDDSPSTAELPRPAVGDPAHGQTERADLSNKHSSQSLSHFTSVPSLPNLKRIDLSAESTPNLDSRNGSQIFLTTSSRVVSSSDISLRDVVTSRKGSSESVQTLSASQTGKKPTLPTDDVSTALPPGGGRHASVAGRMSRYGSAASTVTTGPAADKKKGFLGGFLKRKTGQSVSQAGPDFHSIETSARGSGGASSTTTRMSTSTSQSSLGKNQPSPREQLSLGRLDRFTMSRNDFSFIPEGAISPMQEIGEPELTLDMNLDDMSGIVDPTRANGPPVPAPAPAAAPSQLAASTASSSDATGPTTSVESSMFLQDAVTQTGSFATSHSGSEGSTDSALSPLSQPGRSVLIPTDRASGDPFVRPNPFGSVSPHGSIDGKIRTPPSPHTLTLSPKHALPLNTLPRRPSQLRNVKLGSLVSEGSSDSPDSASLQPLAPAWAQGTTSSSLTMFHDPFKPNASVSSEIPEGVSPSHSTHQSALKQSQSSTHLSDAAGGLESKPPVIVASAIAGSSAAGAVWAAPESWGVEGDDIPDDATSSEEDDWAEGEIEEPSSPPVADSVGETKQPPTSAFPRDKPPPFGFKSADRASSSGTVHRPGTGGGGGRRSKVKTSSGRPSTAQRPLTAGRPGTSGSAHISTTPHHIRIYRGDGSYSTMSLPLNATTADIISVLSGASEAPAGKRITTNMRLYLRAGGQDRQLLPSEKPLAIQDRRLRQAGYTDAEMPEDLGKDDLYILCKFIYQTPNLPVMNPEEESSYDSFEFIDIAARDLLTIPIFLHLHAHNIIILNVSRNPMTDIPLDFIQACTSLKELRMSYMALKRIPVSICASTTLSRLDVSCNRIADLENVPLHEIRTLTSLKVQNNKLASIPSYFAQMKALKYLNISNNKFETFPAVVSQMSNLVDLDVSFNTIAELPSEMSNLKSLERLAAFGNELSTFPASFSTLANLRALDVRRNKLTDLTSVYALPNLTILQADHNNLVTLDAQLGAKVRQFSVPHNSITRFTLAPQLNMKAVTYALTRLDLSHGKISTLADEAFSGLINLADLRLDFNQFIRLPSTIEELVNLRVLSCTDNLLETLPAGIGRLQKLQILNVHNNNMSSIPAGLWACSSLESFNASSNLIKTMPDPPPIDEIIAFVGSEKAAELDLANPGGILPAPSSIRTLLLADNRFTDDVFLSIVHAPHLRVLNLSFNDIFEVPPNILNRLEKLEQLYLSGNKLTSLPAEDLEKMQSLRVLHLNGNKLQTLPSELGALGNLQHLDVGSNVLKYNIANWPYDWNWNWNTALKYLNMSGNKRLEIKPTSAQDMSHTSSFRKDLSNFTALSELRLLGLMDVTLRIPSLPDESDEKRVRTSFSDINNMAYGISDMIGSTDHLAMFDMVVPNFRGKDTECIFGMFGRAVASNPSGKIPKFLQESFGSILSHQLDKLANGEDVTQAMRRSFLHANRATFKHLMEESASGRKSSVSSSTTVDTMFRNWSPSPTSHFRTGSSGAVVYLVEKTMHVANVGDCLVVMSRKGEAELLSKLHDPTDREETARIRHAEAWVSPKGYVNDEKDIDISRAIGYFQHFPSVNASPEVRTRELSESDEFVIIGNHSLWKCCSYQTAVDIARTERDDPMMAAQKLRDFAISYGAEGSVMVMVVNVADLFYGRGSRRRGMPGSSITAEGSIDESVYVSNKRNLRRRYEEFGDKTLNRLQQEIEPPTGQVAIVFTDIVNSTHLWETNPGMPTAIKMHHTFMRRQLRLDGGYEVKTEGDSFMVSFQTVTAALLWAFNCQIGLLREEWPRELLEAPDGMIVHDSEGNVVQRGLRVRMGVHWGAPSCERDPITRRMDYYGPMVNRAARINASADGGQLMASQDVINEIQALRDYAETLDEAGQSDMPPEMKREVAELKRIGFEVKEMGERKLKGLEVPEKLHLLYPKSLAGRFEISNELRANVEVADPRTVIAEPRQIEIEEVRELSKLVLRLESLCTASHSVSPSPQSPGSPTPTAPAMELTPSRRTLGINRVVKLPPPAYLGPSIRDEMNDEELTIIIESLTARVENVMSTLYIKSLGGFSSVLAALEQATKIDPRLIVHALALMNGAISPSE